nr:tRNA (adenosine(37)-N6)-dimethylallyltransferase MiaA [uncultured Ligilactobacillus sp.]
MVEKVLMIVGPTAVGKTSLSIKLAQHFNGQVISGDSMQVYQNLNIGTAKVTAEEMQGVRHYLLDEIPITERFSVADFKNKTQQAIQKIYMDNALPILVGGTGFYLQSFIDNYHFGKDAYASTDKLIREKYYQFAEENGKQALWEKLNEIDPDAASKIPIANTVRIIRALEVYEKTGKLFSQQKDHPDENYDFLIIGLNTNRKILYERINERVDIMMNDGLLEEAKYLFENGGLDLPSGKGIGYKEFYPYFEGKESLQNCISNVKKNSRHYAKRQLTWFRNKMNVNWFDLVQNFDEDYNKIIKLVTRWLKENKNGEMA